MEVKVLYNYWGHMALYGLGLGSKCKLAVLSIPSQPDCMPEWESGVDVALVGTTHNFFICIYRNTHQTHI